MAGGSLSISLTSCYDSQTTTMGEDWEEELTVELRRELNLRRDASPREEGGEETADEGRWYLDGGKS